MILGVLVSSLSFAQIQTVNDWNRERLLYERKAADRLFHWGWINLGSGIMGVATMDETHNHFWFLATNGIFGLVNTGMGLNGIYRNQKKLTKLPTLEEGYSDMQKKKAQVFMKKGIDISFIAGGLLFYELDNLPGTNLSRLTYNDKHKDIGASLIVQGGVLLIFDTITALSYRKSEIHIIPVFTPNGAGLGFQSNLERQQPKGIAWF